MRSLPLIGRYKSTKSIKGVNRKRRMEHEGERAVRYRRISLNLPRSSELGGSLVPERLRGSMLTHNDPYLALWL